MPKAYYMGVAHKHDERSCYTHSLQPFEFQSSQQFHYTAEWLQTCLWAVWLMESFFLCKDCWNKQCHNWFYKDCWDVEQVCVINGKPFGVLRRFVSEMVWQDQVYALMWMLAVCFVKVKIGNVLLTGTMMFCMILSAHQMLESLHPFLQNACDVW